MHKNLKKSHNFNILGKNGIKKYIIVLITISLVFPILSTTVYAGQEHNQLIFGGSTEDSKLVKIQQILRKLKDLGMSREDLSSEFSTMQSQGKTILENIRKAEDSVKREEIEISARIKQKSAKEKELFYVNGQLLNIYQNWQSFGIDPSLFAITPELHLAVFKSFQDYLSQNRLALCEVPQTIDFEKGTIIPIDGEFILETQKSYPLSGCFLFSSKRISLWSSLKKLGMSGICREPLADFLALAFWQPKSEYLIDIREKLQQLKAPGISTSEANSSLNVIYETLRILFNSYQVVKKFSSEYREQLEGNDHDLSQEYNLLRRSLGNFNLSLIFEDLDRFMRTLLYYSDDACLQCGYQTQEREKLPYTLNLSKPKDATERSKKLAAAKDSFISKSGELLAEFEKISRDSVAQKFFDQRMMQNLRMNYEHSGKKVEEIDREFTDSLLAKRTELSQGITDLREQITADRQHLQTIQGEGTAEEPGLAKLTREANEFADHRRDLFSRVKGALDLVLAFQQRIQQEERQRASREAEDLAKSKTTVSEQREEISRLQRQLEQARTDLEGKEIALAQTQSELERRRSLDSSIRSKFEIGARSLESKDAEISELNHRVVLLTTEVADLKRKLDERNKQISKLNDKIHNFYQIISTLDKKSKLESGEKSELLRQIQYLSEYSQQLSVQVGQATESSMSNWDQLRAANLNPGAILGIILQAMNDKTAIQLNVHGLSTTDVARYLETLVAQLNQARSICDRADIEWDDQKVLNFITGWGQHSHGFSSLQAEFLRQLPLPSFQILSENQGVISGSIAAFQRPKPA